MTKTLKSLEGRHLVKTAKSVTSKSKKLYMLYELTPAKEITGGPWYTDQEFDYEFVKHLSSYVLSYVKEQTLSATPNSTPKTTPTIMNPTKPTTPQETPPLKDIAAAIKVSGISKIDLSMEEVKLIVSTLVYDGLLEEVRG
ncbi:unnamed protein product, partial [Ectocarpus sp. 12 AP-2014]